MASLELRQVRATDMDQIFDRMRDPVSVRMAAFTAPDPQDRKAFEAHMSRVLGNLDNVFRIIEADGAAVGTIAHFSSGGVREVTYWIDRARWGEGIATCALGLLLEDFTERPVRARAAQDNLGSLKVLQKCGFEVVGTEVSFAPGRGCEIAEMILELS